jgi:hypothetical protein
MTLQKQNEVMGRKRRIPKEPPTAKLKLHTPKVARLDHISLIESLYFSEMTLQKQNESKGEKKKNPLRTSHG